MLRFLFLIALQLSPSKTFPLRTFHLAMSGNICWFSLQRFKELMFFSFFQIVWSVIGLLQLSLLVSILLLPAFWAVFLSSFLLLPKYWLLGFCSSEDEYQGFGFHQYFVFVASIRRFPPQILAVFLSLPKLWQFFSVYWFDQLPASSSDLRGSQHCFFAKCKHFAIPSFLRFVSFLPVTSWYCYRSVTFCSHCWGEWSLPLSKLSVLSFP